MKVQIENIRGFLKTEFEKELFNAAVAYLDKTSDPLRFNSFSAAMRELSRHILQRLAPDVDVKKCSWFKVETNNGAPTRKQKVIYAVQGGLSEEFVDKNLDIEPKDEIKEVIESINLLSKYTHVNEKTFNIPQADCESLSIKVLDSFISIFQLVEQLRHEIHYSLHDYISTELDDTFMSNMFSDLDILSSQTIAETSELESFEIINITPEKIIITGNGNIEVSLNYGKYDDAAEIKDSFPYEFKCHSEIDEPRKIILYQHDIEVDTTSWYE
ncbi:pPIWI-associating nuclease domain-containing protein [Desulforhopalus singaporensis]|uniref:Uncharacterized protein n=1 Tax=Desulforhopalus singaporensis TaxID=91360 RepID=A0A1H0VSY8_9BACT|nr:hypothetical protein [Desulforhopalus singaporensis]SDP81709.1 hypothetical protein SAMN05660330_04226 [Desulforhopalus singaporensis]